MTNMHVKFSHKKPPIYDACVKAFGVDWDKGIIITYGDTVHSKDDLPANLVAHESVHVTQQTSIGAEIWWRNFLADPKFRLSQEVPAYRAQWRFAKENMSRDEQRSLKKWIIKSMVQFYGGMCTKREAEDLIFLQNEKVVPT
jgi:hypothetical protein